MCKVRRIVDILNSCTHNGFPVVYSQEERRAVYHEMGPKLPEVVAAVQGDAGSNVSPEASKTSAGSSEGEISLEEDSTEVPGRRPSVRFDSASFKGDRRASFASSTSSTSTTVEDRLNSTVAGGQPEQSASASSRFARLSRPGSFAGSASSLESFSRRSSKPNDADKLKDAAVAAEVALQSQNGALSSARPLTPRLLRAHVKALGSSAFQG